MKLEVKYNTHDLLNMQKYSLSSIFQHNEIYLYQNYVLNDEQYFIRPNIHKR